MMLAGMSVLASSAPAQQTASQLSNNIFRCRPGSSAGERKKPNKAKAVNQEMLLQTNAEKLFTSSSGYFQLFGA